jgi:hypothetical protein
LAKEMPSGVTLFPMPISIQAGGWLRFPGTLTKGNIGGDSMAKKVNIRHFNQAAADIAKQDLPIT